VVGQTEVIVRAKIQHTTAIGQFDLGRLRAGDDAFGLEQPLGADRFELGGVAG
jgi:hypothetical protein